MARINIEDSLFKDARFFNLMAKVGSMQTALGNLIWAFIVAQKYYLDESNERLIPDVEWSKQGCSDLLIEVGLAERRDLGVYVSGSEKQFSWLLQRVEAGRKGGLSGREINAALSEEDRIKREKARKKITNAVHRGRLQKPSHCENCSSEANLEAHHSDYDKPFEVNWVCKKCHHQIHDSLSKSFDENNKQSITSVKRVEAVAKPLNSLLLSPNSLLNTQTQSLSQNSISTVVEVSTPVQVEALKGLFIPSNENELISGLPASSKARWTALYEDREFIHRETLKAFGWCENNSKRKPKSVRGWVQFLSSWYERSWPKHQKTIKANDPKMSESEMMAILEKKI